MPKLPVAALAALACAPSLAAAQAATAISREQQIAAAVSPLPRELRDGATVLGYDAQGKLGTLREGRGPMVCLADDPAVPRFHVACYHRSLEPFMARGRALRAQGVRAQEAVDSARHAEIKAGRLTMPDAPASLYSLTGPPGSPDPATGASTGASPLHVIYVPFATAETTGLSTVPTRGSAWLMNPGTPKAHVMFTPTM